MPSSPAPRSTQGPTLGPTPRAVPGSVRHRRRALAALLAAAALASGCDNPACVFGPGNCLDTGGGGGPGGIGSRSAAFPSDGTWLASAAPAFVRAAPEIADAHPQTPLIVEFDQSLDPASLAGAFELVDSITFQPVQLLDPPALVGDGRVVVLTVPTLGNQSPLLPGNTYVLRFRDQQRIADVTGQAFDFGNDQDILEVGIANTPPAAPRLLYSYPADDSVLASDLTEFVAVFDRPMNAATFSTSSFAVTVDGNPPTPNPAPSSLILTGLQVATPVLQVWRWSSSDASGLRQSLGADAAVRVRLSASGSPLQAVPAQGAPTGTLPTTDIDFRTALFRAPASVRKAPGALPPNAIGGPNLAGGSVLEVTLADPAGNNDSLEIYIIGGSPANNELLKAEQRTVTVASGATVVALGEDQLDLREANGTARFRDGDLEFMVRVRRGTAGSAARRTDGDPATSGFQRLALDLLPPRLLGLGPFGTEVTLLRSELGGFVAVGRGDEEIHFVRVSTSVGDNHTGDAPAVALRSPGGRFIAARVAGAPDVLDPSGPPITYTIEAFDRALNPAPPAVGTFVQVGTVGPGADPTGGTVRVRVHDADSLELLAGALVMAHEDDGVTLTDLGSATTGPDGVATVPAAATGATVVTVQRAQYDSFTLFGVPTERLDVPLARAGTALATLAGTVRSPGNSGFATTTNWLADNRLPQPGTPLLPTATCLPNVSGQIECLFGPLPVRARRLGLTTFFATDPGLSQVQFQGPLFLRGFATRLSDEAPGFGEAVLGVSLTVDLNASPAIAFAAHNLDVGPVVAGGVFGAGSGPLVPTVTVEGFGYGLEGAPTVGIGNPYSIDATSWLVLGATPFAATPAGELVQLGALEGDLYLRAEVADVAGNRVGTRPSLSGSGGFLTPIDVPALLAPAGTTGGEAFAVTLRDVVPDGLAMDGLYRVTLVDATGRRWQLWAFDPPGSGTVRLGVPPVAGLGGTSLADGQHTARAAAFAWPGLDRTRFLWADVERRPERFAFAAAAVYTQD